MDRNSIIDSTTAALVRTFKLSGEQVEFARNAVTLAYAKGHADAMRDANKDYSRALAGISTRIASIIVPTLCVCGAALEEGVKVAGRDRDYCDSECREQMERESEYAEQDEFNARNLSARIGERF